MLCSLCLLRLFFTPRTVPKLVYACNFGHHLADLVLTACSGLFHMSALERSISEAAADPRQAVPSIRLCPRHTTNMLQQLVESCNRSTDMYRVKGQLFLHACARNVIRYIADEQWLFRILLAVALPCRTTSLSCQKARRILPPAQFMPALAASCQ